MKKIKIITSVLFASVLLVSCFKNDNETALEINCDAYMIKKMVGEQPAYAIAFYVYGNQMMKSGTVTQVGGLGEQINLGVSPNSIFTLTNLPTENDFKSFPPTASEYLFKVSAESGATNESSDYLDVKNIEIPEIIETAIGVNQKLIDISWNPVAGADGYLIKIAEEDGTYIYSSGGMETDLTTVTINVLTGNWTKQIEIGKPYSIEVHAFAYEENTEELTAPFNVEEISIGAVNIVWE
jgi:hypothetical protein